MTMKQTKQAMIRHNSGFSMIDVLIAIVVLATGLLALAALQGAVTRNASDARTRGQVAAYAEGLIDQMRASGFSGITDGTTTLSASAGTTAQKAAASALQNATGISGVSTSVAVSHYYGSGTTFSTTKPSDYISGSTPEYKEVNVTTSWTDALGQSRSLKLSTIAGITSVDQNNGLDTANPLSSSSTMVPTVHQFRPDYTAGVIPIAIDPNASTAATNPKPEILGTNTQTLAGVSFNVLTYNNPTSVNGNANQVQIQQQVDTRVIGCHCKYGAGVTDTASVFAQPFRPTYWNGTRYSTPAKTSWTFTNLGADPAYSSTQDEFCDVCCRDRNDTGNDALVDKTAGKDGVLFNPWNTDYDHWGYDASNTLVRVATAPSANGSTAFNDSTSSYVNACRLIRVNGQYSVATDMQDYFFGLLATDTAQSAGLPTNSSSTNVASSPSPTSTAKANYSNFVTTYLGENLASTSTVITAASFPYDTPANGSPTTKNGGTATNAATLWAAKGLNAPANIDINYTTPTTDYRYLHARGFYIDHLEPAAVSVINDAIAHCPITATNTLNDCVFPFVPFTTINLTELALWTTDIAGGQIITVSNNAITGVATNGAPLRGAVNALSTAANNGSGNAIARMGFSNSAVTGVLSNAPINTEDKSRLSDSQQFTFKGNNAGGSGGGTVYFDFTLSGLPQIATYGSSSAPTITWAGTSTLGTTSTGTSTTCQKGSAGSYSIIYASSCFLSGQSAGTVKTPLSATQVSPWTGPIGMNVTVSNYNAQILGSATTGGNVSGCTGEVKTQCNVYTPSSITLGGNTLNASSLSISTSDSAGMKVSSIITVPVANALPVFAGFSSATSTSPDQLTISFTQDTGSSYTVSGTCGGCNSSGKNCNYTPGVCTQ